jgi:hypothetical protein
VHVLKLHVIHNLRTPVTTHEHIPVTFARSIVYYVCHRFALQSLARTSSSMADKGDGPAADLHCNFGMEEKLSDDAGPEMRLPRHT